MLGGKRERNMKKGVTSFHPPDVGDDDHIIRRLGWAVVKQWSRLPPDAQERVREQAIFVWDKHQTVQLAQQIDAFVREHGWSKDA
jgi:hypothetical protein